MLLDVYGAGEEPIQGVNSKELASSIEEDTKLCPLVCSGLDEAMLHLSDFIKDLDVLLVQGAGNVSGISNKLKKSNA
jgi:UDP-N-acetylmuramate--alanine ligase